jgi:hypothetical protein
MREAGFAAAHIVPAQGFARRSVAAMNAAKFSRDTLARVGIDINSRANGFWSDSTRHLGSHTNRYLIDLANELRPALTKADVEAALERMLNRLYAGMY